MIKTLSHAALLTIAAFALAACGGKAKAPAQPPADAPTSDAPTTAPPPAEAAAKVCCESFGYGAQMVQCCESYEWTTAEACTVPPGFVGGGKQVVAADKCGG
jgi:hypothetical protein